MIRIPTIICDLCNKPVDSVVTSYDPFLDIHTFVARCHGEFDRSTLQIPTDCEHFEILSAVAFTRQEVEEEQIIDTEISEPLLMLPFYKPTEEPI